MTGLMQAGLIAAALTIITWAVYEVARKRYAWKTADAAEAVLLPLAWLASLLIVAGVLQAVFR